jgi:hypothetical protein
VEIEIALRVFQTHVVGVQADDSAPKPQSGGLTEQIMLLIESVAPVEGMTPAEVVQGLKEQLDLDAKPDHVRTTLWRLAERYNKLTKKEGGRYALPQTNTGPEVASGPVGEERKPAEPTETEPAKPGPVISLVRPSSRREALLTGSSGELPSSTPNPPWLRRT